MSKSCVAICISNYVNKMYFVFFNFDAEINV